MIVQKIVTAHHGSIKVESEVGKGTVFYVSLPVMVKTRTTEAANALIST
jgi:signal transduction histidine kinase